MTDAPAAAPVLTDAPVLAHLVRGGFVESVHRASVVVTAPDGSVEQVWGEASSPMFPRSSNKPVQALAMVRHGLDLPDDLLALVCASHSGEPFHLEGVRRILAGAGLSEEDLQNTPTLPLQEGEHDRWIREGLAPSSIAQNCSGKHAGMLATCVAAGWDTATYRDPGHPLQLAIADAVAELAGEPVSALAVDGCGAPVMAISLAGLARSFGAIAAAPGQEPGSAPARIATAIRNAPEYLGGTDRDVTALIRATPGLIAKDGAESVVAVGLEDGRGVAVKVADGGGRARMVILAAALRAIGVRSEALAQLEHSPVLGHGEPVGALVAVGF
ncbi:MAG: asparaginase [Actinobacteria bacterium]|nr:asparaginase [Actinomycetota bacterium]